MPFRRELLRISRKLEAIITGIIAFILASIAFWSFEKAVFNPLVGWLTGLLGESYQTYLLLLIVSSIILVFILKRKLPFTK